MFIMYSNIVSIDIIKYLQEKKGYTVADIALIMETTPQNILDIYNNKYNLTSCNVDSYLNYANLKFWEFALEAIPLAHLPEKAKKKIFICKELSDYIKSKNNNK